MKKGNNRSNEFTSKKEQKNGFGSMQEKRTEQGKDSMKQPKSQEQHKNGFMKPEKRMESGKGSMNQFNKNMNNNKDFKKEENKSNGSQSKYFGNYKKTSANNGSEDIECRKCKNMNCHCK